MKDRQGPQIGQELDPEDIGQDGDEKGAGGEPQEEEVKGHPQAPGYKGAIVHAQMTIKPAAETCPRHRSPDRKPTKLSSF